MLKHVAIVGSVTAIAAGLLTGVLTTPASADTGCPTPSGSLSGAGSSASPYLISSKEDLQEFKDDPTYWGSSGSLKYTRFTADIDMGGCTWTSVIGSGSPAFFGDVDGGGFQITGLDISGSTNYIGLFGITGTGTHIYDLTFTGDVTNTARYTGGLIGYAANNSRVTNVHVTGNVDGDSEVGGLIGNAAGNNSQTVTVTGSSATGDVRGTSSVVGGLIGYVQYVSIANTFARGDVSGSSSTSGGLLGNVSNNVSLENSYTTGIVRPSTGGGLAGQGTPATTTASYSDTDTGVTVRPSGTGKTSAELQDISTFSTWSISSGYDASSTWGICSAVNDGYPFLTGAYISDPCSSGGGGETNSAPPARYTFVFLLPDGTECANIGPVTVIDGQTYTLPGVEADCRATPEATVAGWIIPVPEGFTGAGSSSLPFNPGHAVDVSDSQRFTVVPFEPILTIELDSNVGEGDACVANEVDFADPNRQIMYSWVPRADFSMARLPGVTACTPPGHVLAGWNTAADGSGETLKAGQALPEGWATAVANAHRLYAMWVPVS